MVKKPIYSFLLYNLSLQSKIIGYLDFIKIKSVLCISI